MRDHDEITVRVKHEDFALPYLSPADLAPDLARASIKRPSRRFPGPLIGERKAEASAEFCNDPFRRSRSAFG
jgi:hypothetical protein